MTSKNTLLVNGGAMSAAAELAPNRRSFLAQVASSVALAGSAAPALGEPADPIFGTLQAHKAAVASLGPAIDRQSELEREIPRGNRRSRIDAYGESIVASDDPRWIDCEGALKKAFDAETEAAIALVSILPTTGAGLLALLQYAIAVDTDGERWPDLLEDENSKRPRSWHHFLIANLIEILPSMVRA